jgi:hypothetical protein
MAIMSQRCNCTKETAAQNFTNLDRGQPWECQALYAVPKQAEDMLAVVREEIQNRRSCFRVVTGEHGDGKTAMLRYIQRRIASECDICYSSILYEKDWIGSETSFNRAFLTRMVSAFALPDGRRIESLLVEDASFRERLDRVLYHTDGYDLGLATTWKDYAVAMHKACGDNANVRRLAISFLKGEGLLPEERKELGVTKKNVWESNPTPTMNAMKFYSTLSRGLGYRGFLLTLDEIEQLGFLGFKTGRTLLSRHRDFVNLQDEVLKDDGFHLFYSISRWYLEEAGILAGSPEAAGMRVSTYRPKVKLSDVDRMDRIVRPDVTIPTTLEDDQYLDVIGQMKVHYQLANPGKSVAGLSEQAIFGQATANVLSEGRAKTTGNVVKEAYRMLRAGAVPL